MLSESPYFPYMPIIVERREAESLDKNWALVYGRRKVVKKFILGRFYPWDYFVLVSKDSTLLIDGADVEKFVEINDFISFLSKALKKRRCRNRRVPEIA